MTWRSLSQLPQYLVHSTGLGIPEDLSPQLRGGDVPLHFPCSIPIQRASVRPSLIALEGLVFPHLPLHRLYSFGYQLESPVAITPHQQWSVDGRKGNGPRASGTKLGLRTKTWSAPGLESK